MWDVLFVEKKRVRFDGSSDTYLHSHFDFFVL